MNRAAPDLVKARDEEVPPLVAAPAEGYRGSRRVTRQARRRGWLSDGRAEDAGGASANSGRICCRTTSRRTSADHRCRQQGRCKGPCALPWPPRHVHGPNVGRRSTNHRREPGSHIAPACPRIGTKSSGHLKATIPPRCRTRPGRSGRAGERARLILYLCPPPGKDIVMRPRHQCVLDLALEREGRR